MNDIEQIMRINSYIQHSLGTLTFNGKTITCVALDHSCMFDDREEIALDDNQVAEIYRQTFYVPSVQEAALLQAKQDVKTIWRANTPHHLMSYGIEAKLREKGRYLTRESIETLLAELVSESEKEHH